MKTETDNTPLTPHLTPYPSLAGDDLVARRAKGARGDAARRRLQCHHVTPDLTPHIPHIYR